MADRPDHKDEAELQAERIMGEFHGCDCSHCRPSVHMKKTDSGLLVVEELDLDVGGYL